MPIQKWEYEIVTLHVDVIATPNGDHTDNVFNELGEKGWELVQIVPITGSSKAIFKRPLQ